MQSPASDVRTTFAAVEIAARASDALSGLASATCNGRPAAMDATGTIRCVITLAPGVNDIVVEASDRADNSGSAGIRVTRAAATRARRVLPEKFAMLVGQPRRLQAFDDALAPVGDVIWQVDQPSLAELALDGSGVLTPKAQGSSGCRRRATG